MINHKNFCKSLAKKGGTITLSSNDLPSIGAFNIGKEGSALGACSQNWERFGSELLKEVSFGSRSESRAKSEIFKSSRFGSVSGGFFV